VPFTWSTIPAAQGYYLTVGSSVGAADVIWSGFTPASQTSHTGAALPSGKTLYARLYTGVNNAWSRYQDISFTTAPPA
jgi:hypothetical protein